MSEVDSIRVTGDATEVKFNQSTYGDVEVTPDVTEFANNYLEEVRNVNLDEVVIDEVPVAITIYTQVSETDPDGFDVVRTTARVRHANIRTKVPMRVFNKMLMAHDQMMKESAAEKKIDWMTEQVLAVWKVTEPNMTKDELIDGLEFEQISGLFSRFFDKQLRLLRGNRRRG